MVTVMKLSSQVDESRFGRVFERVPGGQAMKRLAPLDGFVLPAVQIPGVKQR